MELMDQAKDIVLKQEYKENGEGGAPITEIQLMSLSKAK
jgi:hypothetical protein